jgi:hypothetical protein
MTPQWREWLIFYKPLIMYFVWLFVALAIARSMMYFRTQKRRPVEPIVRVTHDAANVRMLHYRSALISLNQILFHSGTHEIAGSKTDMVIAIKKWIEVGAKEVFFIYTIFPPADVEDAKQKIFSALAEQGIVVPQHRILFTSTEAGRGSVARQISPGIFIDPREELVAEMKGKIPEAVSVKNAQAMEALMRLSD